MGIKTVHLPYEVISDIVKTELNDQLTYHLSVISGTSGCPVSAQDIRESYQLVSALIKVLEEYE
jgi:hypothetical protein